MQRNGKIVERKPGGVLGKTKANRLRTNPASDHSKDWLKPGKPKFLDLFDDDTQKMMARERSHRNGVASSAQFQVAEDARKRREEIRRSRDFHSKLKTA